MTQTHSRVALITGGARGLGRAIGLALAKQGWSIAICYRSSKDEAEKTIEEVKALHKQADGMAFQCDVSDPVAAEELVRQVESAFGRIDALINGAGPYHRVGLFKESIEGWHSMFDNNLHPVFYLSRFVAPGMKERKWGRILSFSMATAEKVEAKPMVTAHYIAKLGILALTRALARPLAPHGITVNTISPGYIDTQSAPQEELDRMLKHIPAGYIGKPDDIVGCALFLLSEDAHYVNGANITISGGWGV